MWPLPRPDLMHARERTRLRFELVCSKLRATRFCLMARDPRSILQQAASVPFPDLDRAHVEALAGSFRTLDEVACESVENEEVADALSVCSTTSG